MPSDLTPRAALSRLLQSPDFQRFEAELARVSAFHILGIERRELSHAAFLGWLLNPRGHHGLGTAPLRSFLLLVCGLADSDTPGPDAVDIDGLDLHSAQVELESAVKVPGSGRYRRLDVFVTVPEGDNTRTILVIEYKVDAQESEDQTTDYAAWASAEALKQGWLTSPRLVYLCPGQGQPSSPQFVVMDYDAYLPWLNGLLALRPSETAVFLLTEFRACLGLRTDVREEQQDALRQAILSAEEDAIELLQRTTLSRGTELQPVILRHREALNALGLFRSRQSKGHSSFVDAFRKALIKALPSDVWHIGGGEGSLVAIYLPAVAVLRKVTGETHGLTSVLRLHLFMERPRRERARAVLEVIGNHPQLDAVESRRLRIKLAALLRTQLEEHFDQATRGQIIGAFILAAPGIVGLKDDTDRRVRGLSERLAAQATRARVLGEVLESWMVTLEQVLREAKP